MTKINFHNFWSSLLKISWSFLVGLFKLLFPAALDTT